MSLVGSRMLVTQLLKRMLRELEIERVSFEEWQGVISVRRYVEDDGERGEC